MQDSVPVLLQELVSPFSLFSKKGGGGGEKITKIFCNCKNYSKQF